MFRAPVVGTSSAVDAVGGLEEMRLHWMLALKDALPGRGHGVVGLLDHESVDRIDRGEPLLGEENALRVAVHQLEVPCDLVGTHLVQRADVDEKVGVQRLDGVELIGRQEGQARALESGRQMRSASLEPGSWQTWEQACQ